MEDYGTGRSSLSRILTWAIVVVAVVVAAKILFWVVGLTVALVGTALGIVGFLLFTILPLAIVAWLAVKLFGYARRRQTV